MWGDMKQSNKWVGIAGLLFAIVFVAPHHAKANWGYQTPGIHNPQVAPPSNGVPAAGVSPRAHYVIHGGYVAAGVGMRDTGFGSITIALGELPNGAFANGCIDMVLMTRRLFVSMTDTVSLFVLHTNRFPR